MSNFVKMISEQNTLHGVQDH